MLYQKFPFEIWNDPNFTYCFRANISQITNWLVLIEACCHQQSTVCGLALACLSLCWCRIPPDLTQECVLGDDEGRIWYCPLEIVDIPSPGGTKRHFCFLWSPSSGINTASCNLSLELSKTLRHLMTLQGRLSSSWRAGGRGRRGDGVGCGGVPTFWTTTACGGRFKTQLWQRPQKWLTAVQSPSKPRPIITGLLHCLKRQEAHRDVSVHPIGRWAF